ncbi:unnamed protein product [Phytophthora lilii]|uniref:Unnamed protein product n=1 Tax=Phytophthora lilii TaxID=2077276 RepID=A0A9W6XB54_9STRA|nr:unnamed protein product [Phytophthora lilii]
MFFFNPRGSAGSYRDNADLNVDELKATMKNLISNDRPQKTQAAVWATDLDKTIRKVDASTQTEGGKVWAYQPKRAQRAPGGGFHPAPKQNKTVKTFAI